MAEAATRAPHVDCDPRRVEELFREQQHRVWVQTDRVFAMLMVAQWAFAVFVALVWSPYGWAGKQSAVHLHLQAAVLLGGLLLAFPLSMIALRPAAFSTRMVIACAQMLWSALLIHLSGGRIETHFHVFGSLAFLAFYRDWRVLVPATVVVTGDHLIRGIYWPESVYGIVNPEWWRFLEHAGWVVFEDIVLVLACVRATDEMRAMAQHQALVEARYAAVGRLAASVGHELRNPLAAVKSAAAYLSRKVAVAAPGGDGRDRSQEFVKLIDRQADTCSAIVSDLIEYARARPPLLGPCSLHALASEAIGGVRLRPDKALTIKNEVAQDLPPPTLDREQFRRVLTNLVQNAIDKYPKGRPGTIAVRAVGSARDGWKLSVSDDGDAIAEHELLHVFEPLISDATKGTGTGLGLAIVAAVVERHSGKVEVDSVAGRGTTFMIQLPPLRANGAAAARGAS